MGFKLSFSIDTFAYSLSYLCTTTPFKSPKVLIWTAYLTSLLNRFHFLNKNSKRMFAKMFHSQKNQYNFKFIGWSSNLYVAWDQISLSCCRYEMKIYFEVRFLNFLFADTIHETIFIFMNFCKLTNSVDW